MIKNIVFDMGNVLVQYAPAKFVGKFVEDTQVSQLLVEEIFQSVEWIQFDRGTITKKEMIRKIAKRIPNHLYEKMVEIIEKWYEELQPIDPMGKIIKDLKQKGYHLFILSNAPSDYYYFKDKVAGIDYFDGAFISSDWKLIKPEPAIYQSFYSHFQLVPSECFFIDDLPLNIEAAYHTGMPGYVFRGNFDKLLSAFENAGIQINERKSAGD